MQKLISYCIKEKINLKELLVSTNELDDDCMQIVGKFIQNNPKLTRVALGNNALTNEGVNQLLSFITKKTKLKSLDISNHSNLTDDIEPNLKKMIKISKVDYLDVRFTEIEKRSELALLLAENALKYNAYSMDFTKM